MRIIFILAFALMQLGAMAANAPQNVEKSFKTKYPTATDVEWYDEEDGTFAAYFYINEESKTAKFNTAGNWTETRTFLDADKMPRAINNSLKSTYKNAEVSSVTMIELPNNLSQYEISAEANNMTYLLTYDDKGTLLKTLEQTTTDTELMMGNEDEE